MGPVGVRGLWLCKLAKVGKCVVEVVVVRLRCRGHVLWLAVDNVVSQT